MDRNIQKNGLVNLLALLVIGTASQVLAHKSAAYADEAGLGAQRDERRLGADEDHRGTF